MNVFFIRTRLQCLIASRLIKTVARDQPYYAVFLYQRSRDEDSPAVYRHYERFRIEAFGSSDIVSSDGIANNLLRILPILWRSQRAGGRCYLSVVDSVPVALAYFLTPGLTLETFDDGFFNIHPGSRLFGSGPMLGTGVKRRLARVLFPNGSVEWMRTKSKRHHTIFPGRPNILPDERLTILELDWSQLLEKADYEKFTTEVSVIVLGTAHQDFPNPESSRQRALDLLLAADMYIRHPREEGWYAHGKMLDFQSPAEAVLRELSKRSELIVHHFNSTTAVAMEHDARIRFVNHVDSETRKLLDVWW